jgi:predicted TIM-barrel fold metal-dependent hydrolase
MSDDAASLMVSADSHVIEPMSDDAASLMVSADSHVIEPADLYAPLRRDWGDLAPVVRRADDGTDWGWVDGQRTNSFAGGSQTGRRFVDPDSLVLADAIDNVRADVWSPERYVADNLADGVGASVLYPTQQMQHYAVRNSALVAATCRVYNDWLAEFCSASPQRLVGVAALLPDDAVEAARELERAADRGLRGAMVPVALPRGDTYADPRFEPLWLAAEATGLPISLHIGTYRANPRREKRVVLAGEQTDTPRPVQSEFATADLYVRSAFADLVYSGVLERHPGLQLVSAEHEIGWLPHFVERLDYTYTQRATRGYRFRDGAVPSDFVRRQLSVQFCEDPFASHAIAAVGPERALWGGDYPHSEGTFPRSRATVARLLASCSPSAREAVVSANAAQLYGIDPSVLAAATPEDAGSSAESAPPGR